MNAVGDVLWRFSLAFYARAGVAPALLALQDRDGVNVNLVLFAMWAGACRGIRLDPAVIAAARAAIAPLDAALVTPLRDLRRRLRADPNADVQAFRRRIAALELAAERRVQDRLAATVPSAPPAADRLAAASANLALVLGADPPEAAALRRALGAFLVRR